MAPSANFNTLSNIVFPDKKCSKYLKYSNPVIQSVSETHKTR